MSENKYQETLEFLYNRLQAFHRVGAKAYKPGLETTLALSRCFGAPHKKLKFVHIAGTNGKGSTAHTTAAVLAGSGYKTGLYTSPHLTDFSERIRINGQPISQEEVIDFVDRFLALPQYRSGVLDPSFFELATVMALEHFVRKEVEIAVMETGLGGLLDSTNIILPEVSVITNISLDHTALLGNTLEDVATQKAGIIKIGTPVVIGNADNPRVREVFEKEAKAKNSPIVFSKDKFHYTGFTAGKDCNTFTGTPWGTIHCELTGSGQEENVNTVLATLEALEARGWKINADAVQQGFENVCSLTGLRGRWTVFSHDPLQIYDTGHNPGAWEQLSARLKSLCVRQLHIVIGFAADKDFGAIAAMMPKNARYYFVQPDTPRAACSTDIARIAREHGLEGTPYPTVKDGYSAARVSATSDDAIFIGGSNFVVADFLTAVSQ